ncbi:restriction endonuclease subunit S [Vibrio parahaemolyticus]
MGKYSRYPSYKEVDLDYVKTIPDGWKDASLSKLFRIQAGGDVQSKFFSTVKTASHSYPIYTNANDAKAVYGYTSQSNYSRNSITVSGRGEVGFAVYRDHDFDAIIRLLVLSPRVALDCRFFAYFINEVIDFNVQSSAIGQLSTLQISPYKVLIPSREEQTQIANFLDHETAKIDTLIEKQQQLIKLLKEKRQAVISHAVTKGLNPEVPMIDSGVEWLGEVPEHWVVTPYKYLTNEVTVGIVVTPAKYYVDSGVKCLRSLNVAPNIVKDERWVYISEESNKALSKSRVSEGDIVVVRSGQTGTAAVIPKELDGSNCIDLVIVRRSEKICSTFACFQLNSDFARHQVVKGSEGAIQLHFNVEVAKALLVCLPPLAEQMEITAHLLETEQKFKELLNAAEMQISLLKERRTALISAAVTGKIDVRNWQAPTHQDQALEQTA